MLKTNPSLCLVLLAVCGSPGFAGEWKKSFSVSGKADLRVDVDHGEAIVRVWDRNQLEARVTTQGWKIEPGEVRVKRRAGRTPVRAAESLSASATTDTGLPFSGKEKCACENS